MCIRRKTKYIFTHVVFRMTYNLDYGRVSDTIPAHDDAVSCLHLIGNIGCLISGSWDCSVKYVYATTHVRIEINNYFLLEFGKDLMNRSVRTVRIACPMH